MYAVKNTHDLPQLREELIMYSGPITSQGMPTWLLHDPVRNLFFRIDWLTYELLSRWYLKDSQAIIDNVNYETTINAEYEDLSTVIQFLIENELIQNHHRNGSIWYCQKLRATKINWWHWLIHHYLFFRIPMWRPDSWLSRILPYTKLFYSNAFFILTIIALLLGLIAISRQWENFINTLIDYFSWEGMFKYSVTLIFVKFLHELGHAITAKRYGCRVPIMGVAFLVMFPMAYTDVNEAWKLQKRYQRLAVGGAGIVTELIIAAWSTLIWTVLPNGHLRDAAFLLATTTWISTLAINISPFMRFDGYFLLMDWLDMPNLHARIFALARWWLREGLFKLGEQPPELFSRRRYYGLLGFALIIWLYRLIIFSSIAVLVYFWFPKPLGPLLAAIEIGWFIILPILKELNIWLLLKSKILRSYRTWLIIALLASIIMVLVIPWDQRIHAQGLLRPQQYSAIFAPGAAQITSIAVTDGDYVSSQQELFILEAENFAFQKRALRAHSVALRWQAVTASVDAKLRERQKILQEEANKADAELAAMLAEQERYRPVAPFSGHFFMSSLALNNGDWIGKNTLLGVVADTAHWIVETYLSEADLHRVNLADRGNFYSETPNAVIIPLEVTAIDYNAIHDLQDGILSSTRGGTLLTRESNGRIIPESALYRVTLKLTAPYFPKYAQILRGRLVIFSTPKAIMSIFIKNLAALLIREASF